MTKKSESTAVALPTSATADARTGEFGEAHRELAAWLHIDLEASPNVRTERAVVAYNVATQNLVESGLLLASVRHEVGAAAFAEVLEERGMAKQRAYELMNGAALVARLPQEQREQVMALHKSKVAILAGASASAVEAALDDEDFDIDTISVRALRQKIRDLEAQAVDTEAQLESAAAEAKGLKKKLARPGAREDQIPLVVADLRAEAVALVKKAELVLQDLGALRSAITDLGETEAAQEWADATLRLALGGLLALRLQMDGEAAAYLKLMPGSDPTPKPASYLSKTEVREAALKYAELTKVHSHEAELRAWEREQERPRGKGRPANKPETPAGAAA